MIEAPRSNGQDPTLIVLVGLPRSGKTTIARQLNVPIVCPDAIRLALHGSPYVRQAEPWVWAIAKTMARALFLAGHRRVVVDGCHATAKRRAEWQSSQWRREFVLVGGADMKDTCLTRAQELADPEHRRGIEQAIERMAAAFEDPSPSELAEHEREGGTT